jgi:hypothetical protein
MLNSRLLHFRSVGERGTDAHSKDSRAKIRVSMAMERQWSVSFPCWTLEELVGLEEHRPYRFDRNFHPHPKGHGRDCLYEALALATTYLPNNRVFESYLT